MVNREVDGIRRQTRNREPSARRRAPRSVALESTVGANLFQQAFTGFCADLLFWSAAKAAASTLARSILGTPPELVAAASVDEQARVRRFLELMLPITERRLGLINDGRVCASLTRLELEKVKAQTLGIGFADDLYGTYDAARYTCEQIPNGRFVAYPTGGHLGIGHEQDVIDEIAGLIGE